MKFIKDYGCVFLEKISSLVIGDIHIGLEEEFKKLGANIAYTERVIEDIKKCKEKVNAKRIILLGDVKNSIGIPKSKSEIKNIEKFFNSLKEEFEKIYVVKGNHDGLLNKLVNDEKINFFGSRGFRIKDYGFFHGNAYPLERVMKAKFLFCSHFHPKYSLYLEDRKITEMRVFVIAKIKETFGKNKKLIILPPFSPLIVGKEIEELTKEKSVISNLIDEKEIEIISLDGTKIL